VDVPLLAVPEVFLGLPTAAAHESACHFAEDVDIVGAT
jgi:oligopeptide transport system ATP-binding protein